VPVVHDVFRNGHVEVETIQEERTGTHHRIVSGAESFKPTPLHPTHLRKDGARGGAIVVAASLTRKGGGASAFDQLLDFLRNEGPLAIDL
jgi:hypothetical protein